MPRTIAHVVELSGGGPTTVVLNLMRHQKARGDNPVLIACRNLISPELVTETGTDLLYTSSRNPLKIRGVVREIAPLIDKARPDILHLHSAFAGLYGRLALRHLKGARPKVVYCPHGWAFTQETSALKRTAYAMVEKRLLPMTDAIINLVHFEAVAARRYGVTCGRDYIIPLAVADPPDVVARDLGLDPSKINLAFFGRFDRQKGLDHLLKAYQAKPRPGLTLTIFGSKLRGDQRDIAMGEGVTRFDWVPAKDIDSYMRAFDMVVMPSRWEAFALVSHEAMRNARPVLLSNRGGLPEFVIDGFNGIMFDIDNPTGLSDALDRLPELDLARMGRNARSVFESYCDFEANSAKVDQLYDTVLNDVERH